MSSWDDQWITVTPAAIVVKATGATFRTSSITSVRVWHRSSWWWLVYVGVLSMSVSGYYFSCGMVCAGSGLGQDLLGTGALLFTGGLLLIYGARRLPPLQHHVTITVGGSDQGLVYSPDPAWAQGVAQAIRVAAGLTSAPPHLIEN
jgi:hypothetical protein